MTTRQAWYNSTVESPEGQSVHPVTGPPVELRLRVVGILVVGMRAQADMSFHVVYPNPRTTAGDQ